MPSSRLLCVVVSRLVATSLVVALGGCEFAHGPEISSTPPHKDFVGADYRVVSDSLRAYAFWASIEEREALGYIVLLPFGIGGREIAFEQSVPKGQVFTVLSAWREFRDFDPSAVYYRVKMEHPDLPQDVPIRLQLTGENVGAGGGLNPEMFERLPTRP